MALVSSNRACVILMFWIACFVATHRGNDVEAESLVRAMCNLLIVHLGAAYEWITNRRFYLAVLQGRTDTFLLPAVVRHVLASVLAFNAVDIALMLATRSVYASVFVPHHVILLLLGCTPLLTRRYYFLYAYGWLLELSSLLYNVRLLLLKVDWPAWLPTHTLDPFAHMADDGRIGLVALAAAELLYRCAFTWMRVFACYRMVLEFWKERQFQPRTGIQGIAALLDRTAPLMLAGLVAFCLAAVWDAWRT